MKRQKQIDESKEMIAAAFMRLMQDRDYDDLTLSEIAEEAGVNRITLYRHFKTKEKIVLYQAQKTLEEQADRVASEGKPPRDLFRERLEWVKSVPQLSVLMQSREIQELLDGFRIATHTPALEEFFGKRFEQDPQLFHFYFGGVNRIAREWLAGGCVESPDHIADSIVSLTFALASAVRPSEVPAPSNPLLNKTDSRD